MRQLAPIVAAILLAACTFNPDLGDNYFPCKPDGTCPPGCHCLEGQACVPKGDQGPELCAWCEDDQALCRMGKEAWCAYLDSDPENCGGCGNICELPNATAECKAGTCVLLECLDCYQNCDWQDINGCETCTESDPQNCGGCDIACHYPPPSTCEGDELTFYLDNGECVSSQCQYEVSTRWCIYGCENGFCKDDPCLQVTCNLNQHCEDGACVCDDLWSDCDTNLLNGCETFLNTIEDCGDCGFDCGKDSICVNGSCDCVFGFGNCDDNWETGCETDVLSEELHCGTCDIDCEAGLTCCVGQCVDTNTDSGNCGNCTTFCSGMTECCGGTCTDTQLDSQNCGSCGNACQAPTSTCCWGSCLNAMIDVGNCGECSNACAFNIPCHQGACGDQGIHCGATTCDFWLEECCYGANGISCYPAGNCSVRVVECDDDSDCGDSLYCCLVDTPEHITLCTGTCLDVVCSSDAYCSDTDPGTPHCCAGNFYGQMINTCSPERCQ